MGTTLVEQVSFEVCEKEPLANSGAIQSHGVLFFIDKKKRQISYASANYTDWFGEEVEDLLGSDGDEWLEINLPDAPPLPLGAGNRLYIQEALDMGFGDLDVLVSATSHGWILEFEKSASCEFDESFQLSSPDEPVTAKSLENIQQELVEIISKVAGYDRVMLYKFSTDWSGEVLAEVVSKQPGTYLGLRFPATDIPSIARSLYAKLPYRHIPDSSSATTAIMTREGTGEELDLTWSDLRSVSPYHLTYLGNMKVASSFSVSVMVEGKLWGLIACHNHEPRTVPIEARMRCKALVDQYVEILGAYQNVLQREIYKDVSDRLSDLKEASSDAPLAADSIVQHLESIYTLFQSSGAIMVVDQMVVGSDGAPNSDTVLKLHQWFMLNKTGDVVAVDNLPTQINLPELMGVHGVLAMNFRAKGLNNAPVSLYILRPEEIGEIAWAGNQDQLLEAAIQGNLSPRNSFDKWIEVRSGYSRPWSEQDLFTGEQVRSQLADIF